MTSWLATPRCLKRWRKDIMSNYIRVNHKHYIPLHCSISRDVILFYFFFVMMHFFMIVYFYFYLKTTYSCLCQFLCFSGIAFLCSTSLTISKRKTKPRIYFVGQFQYFKRCQFQFSSGVEFLCFKSISIPKREINKNFHVDFK